MDSLRLEEKWLGHSDISSSWASFTLAFTEIYCLDREVLTNPPE